MEFGVSRGQNGRLIPGLSFLTRNICVTKHRKHLGKTQGSWNSCIEFSRQPLAPEVICASLATPAHHVSYLVLCLSSVLSAQGHRSRL